MRSVKHWLGALLCLALALGLLPTAALAEGHWADSAVTALQAVYGQDAGFAATDNAMTEGQAAALLKSMGCSSEKVSEGSDTPLTRAEACEALADVFCLPVASDSSAIDYLAEKHIISGTAEGDLNKEGPVSQAEFAVLTYRVLNSVGGGKGSSTGLNPGSDAYFAWMYLYARKYEGVKFDTTTHQGKITNDVWGKWCSQAKEAGVTMDDAESDYPTTDTTMLDAAEKLVFDYIKPEEGQIFSDVKPGSSFYDGVMYLFDQGILSGRGAGSFEPAGPVSRTDFAILLCRVDKHVNTGNQADGFAGAKAYVTESKGYMDPPDSEADTWWSGTITRQEAITGIMKAVAGTDSADANTAILGRFSDAASVSTDAAPYVAYAVSLGLVSGTAGNSPALDPDGQVSRGMAGVLLYRTLLGVDKTKMEDYRNFVKDLALGEAPESTAAYGLPIAAFRLGMDVAPLTDTQKTLTLQEDWRLTENLDLAVPEGTTLTIAGGCIYEMEGTLQNSGKGTVAFDDAILYPVSGDNNAGKVAVSEDHVWDAGESTQLMELRQPATEPEDPDPEDPDPEQPDPDEPEVPEEPDTPSTPSSGSSSRPSNTTTTTERNPDGSTTTTTTNKTTGTVTETTRYPDGSREVVETKKDGTVTATTTDADGNETKVVENPDGSSETAIDNADGTSSVTTVDRDGLVAAEVTLPAAVVEDAAGEAIALPMPAVRAERDREDAPTVTVDLPRSASVPVEIPVENAGTSTVAVLVKADGTEEVIKTSLTTENGVAVSLSDGDTVKIVDNGKVFYDVPASYWGAEAIDFATSRELFGGTGAVTFEPDVSMNRGMLVTVLYRLENEPNTWGGGSYTDVPEGMYYTDAVVWADGSGIVTGYADATFAPGRDITREEMAVVLYRYAQHKGYDTDQGGMALREYADYGRISAYAQEAMAWANASGLITGDAGMLNPQGSATRAQVATILQRFLYLMDG